MNIHCQRSSHLCIIAALLTILLLFFYITGKSDEPDSQLQADYRLYERTIMRMIQESVRPLTLSSLDHRADGQPLAFLNGSLVRQEQDRRLKTLADFCEDHDRAKEAGSYEALLRDETFKEHMFVDEKRGLMFCYVPQGSSTEGYRFVNLLLNTTGSQPSWRPLSSYEDSGALQRLHKFKRVIFVRDPLFRIISLYIENVLECDFSEEEFCRSLGKEIQTIYREPDQITADGRGTTLKEFVLYTIDMELNSLPKHHHFETVYSLCRPCQARYDFIGKLETLDADASYLLKQVSGEEVWEPASTPWQPPKITTLLKPIETDTAAQLQQIFSEDIQMFGYEMRFDP